MSQFKVPHPSDLSNQQQDLKLNNHDQSKSHQRIQGDMSIQISKINDNEMISNYPQETDDTIREYKNRIQQMNLKPQQSSKINTLYDQDEDFFSEVGTIINQKKKNEESLFQQLQLKNGQLQRKSNKFNKDENCLTIRFRDQIKPETKNEILNKLLVILYGKSSIQIYISNFDSQTYEKIQIVQQSLSLLQIQFQQYSSSKLSYYQKKEIQNNTLLNIPKLEEEFSLIVQKQGENNVSQETKWQIIYQKCFQQLQQTASEINIKIEVMPQEYKFRLFYQTNNMIDLKMYGYLKSFYLQFSDELESIVILVYQCQNMDEASQMSRILNNQIMLQILKQVFETNNVLIDSTQNIKLNHLYNQALVFAIIYNYFEIPIKQLQVEFDQRINSDTFLNLKKSEWEKNKIQLADNKNQPLQQSSKLKIIQQQHLQNQNINLQQLKQSQIYQQNQQQQQPNYNRITIELLQDEVSKQHENELISTINSLDGSEDIQITIYNPKKDEISSLKFINEQNPMQLEFSLIGQNNDNIQTLFGNKFNQKTERNMIEIQIYPQNENNVSQEMKALIFHWKFIEKLKQEAENSDIDIDLNIRNFQYTLTKYGMMSIDHPFYKHFKLKLQDLIILTHQCGSLEETIQKQKLLQLQQIKNTLLEKFQIDSIQFIEIDIIQNYSISKTPKSLRLIARGFQKQNILIFTLMYQDIGRYQISVQQLQKKLNQIMNDLIDHKFENQIIHVDKLLDIDQIKFQISQLSSDIQVQILDPHYDYDKGKQYYDITYNIWILKEKNQNQIINQRLQELKHQIESIINPVIQLRIENEKQRKIWEIYLQHKYTFKQIKVDISDNILIKFISEKEDNQKNKEILQQKLQVLQYFQFTYKLDLSIISVLKQQQIQKLFDKEIQELKDKQKIAYLQTIEIDQQQIKFEVIVQDHSKEFINKSLLEQIIQKINIQTFNQNFNKILQFQNKSKEEFERINKCYIQINNNQTTQVSLSENTKYNIEKQIKEYIDSQDQNIVPFKKQLDSRLLLQRIQQIITFDNILDKKLNIQCHEEDNIIELRGPEYIVNDSKQKLENIIKKEISNLKTLNIKTYSKIWKQINPLLKEIEKLYQCTFSIQGDQEITKPGQDRATLRFKNKVLTLRQGDITKQRCDAIVNSCNEQMNFQNMNQLTGVSEKILESFGPQFRKHTEDLIKRQGKLQDADIYQVPNQTSIKNIISVPTIHYSQADTNIDQFKKHIQQIFNIANKNQLKSLVIPILGGGSAGYFFETVSNIQLNEVLIQMENYQFIENIMIIENQQVKIDILVRLLKNIMYPPQLRQIVYQWWWQDQQGWREYDDIEVNQKIDEGFELYQKNNNLDEVEIVFPFTKQPGTHTVDLSRMIVTDIKRGLSEKISKINSAKVQQYSFGEKPVDLALGEFMELQKVQNQLVFQIFLNRYKVKFSRQNTIQINQQTQFQRNVGVKNNEKQFIQQKCPINSVFDFKEIQVDSIKTNNQEIEIIVQSFDQTNVNNAKQFIDDYIKQQTTSIQWKVININDEERMEIEKFIIKKSITYKGQMNANETLEILCLKSKLQKLNDYLQTIKQRQFYPQNWIPQNTNLFKCDLSFNDEEYKKVTQLFRNSYPQGKIYQINRIQNKLIYKNYIDEKQKLITLKQNLGHNLTDIELDRFVWHGVSGQHPQIIYSGQKEAFDSTYCQNDCMWGRGIYFAENSIYSKKYSYRLNPQDSIQFQGKLVFLLCQISTGKVIELNQNQSLQRPPQDYDCVQGKTGGSNIFVLYGMDVRRAYPAYEVIFE